MSKKLTCFHNCPAYLSLHICVQYVVKQKLYRLVENEYSRHAVYVAGIFLGLYQFSCDRFSEVLHGMGEMNHVQSNDVILTFTAFLLR